MVKLIGLYNIGGFIQLADEKLPVNLQGPFCKVSFEPIDLNSHDQVKDYLLSIGWQPTEWNKSKKTGKITSPKLTEDSFDSIKDDTGKLVARRNVIVHRRRTIENYDDPDNKGILSKIRDDGRVPATGILCGTPTGRTTHSGAVCNVPKANKKVIYGKEMRSLFMTKYPYIMLGADLKGIEARILAHYASLYDGGEYADIVLNGDIHQRNADLIGSDRDTAKSFQYALFYGARAPKIAAICKCNTKQAQKHIDNFWVGNWGVKKLVDRLVSYYKKNKCIVGIDGRKFMIRAEYKILNSLIQGSSAIVFKKWGTIANQMLMENNCDCKQIIAYHDEFDYRCHRIDAYKSMQIIKAASIEAGKFFNITAVPILADVKVGTNWAKVH